MSRAAPTGAHLSLDRLVALAALAKRPRADGWSRGQSAGRSGPRRGSGGDLYDLRPFVDGDDPRQLDPAATARSGRRQIRRCHEEVERSLLLIVDMRGSMFWGTRGRLRSVAAAEAAALEGWRCVLSDGRCGLAILRDTGPTWVPARPGHAAMLEIAGTLARCHDEALAAPGTALRPLAECMADLVPRVRHGTAVILATGFDKPGAAFGATLASLSLSGPLEVLLVQDAVEHTPPSRRVAARIGQELVRGRFGPSPSPDILTAAGVSYRVVPCDRPEDVPA
ncbi:DUF58 domain-containing protein [Litorisediminicola beolgyonensis]|uniref:DUF58 domain-containing protein n=1 Tax=Litorisediminicola beolgyonensis TaxID=1173614 RepID=A0ABW3ZHH9_9RHOB